MKIAVVGLGLIGGSYAKSIMKYTDHEVYALSHNEDSIRKAIQEKSIVGTISEDGLKDMDMTIVAMPPFSTIDFLKRASSKFKKGAIVSDIAGVKTKIIDEVSSTLLENGVNYISLHPMAGRECSGYDNSLSDLFLGKSLIIIDEGNITNDSLCEIYELHKLIGFTKFVRTTKSDHDRIIAYTSEMCHIASSAFVKSPSSKDHNGFSGGSFEDLTRVAYLDPVIWTDIFAINREPLLRELNIFIANLQKYQEALKTEDWDTMRYLLQEGRDIKDNINKVKGKAFDELANAFNK